MKRIFLFVFATVVSVACTQGIEEVGNIYEPTPERLTIGFADDATRVELKGGKTRWTDGDLLTVFYHSEHNQQWKLSEQTADRVGIFEYVSGTKRTDESMDVVALYPYNKDYEYDVATSEVEAMLLATQHYAKDSYAVGENLMVAYDEDDVIQMKNVYGWLRVDLIGNGEKVRKITVTGNNDEQLSGAVLVNAKDATMKLSDTSDAAKSVVLECEGVELAEAATSFYLSLPPQSYSKGVTVSVECRGYEPMTLTMSKELVIARNEIKPMKAVTFESEVATSNVTFEISDTTFFDATMKLSVKGSEGYITGINKSSQFSASSCVNIYETYVDGGFTLKQDADYDGSVLEYFGKDDETLEPGVKYTIWFIDSADEVTSDDVKSWEFTTKAFTDDGDLEISVEDEVVGYEELSVTLTTSGHIYMYYGVFAGYAVGSYSDSDLKSVLLDEGDTIATTADVVVEYDDAEPGEEYIVAAIAVDESGKMGKLCRKSYTMKDFVYNDLSVNLSVEGNANIAKTIVNATCDGASKFLYVYAASKGDDWKLKYGGSVAKAGEYIIINADNSNVHSSTDGKLVLNGLTKEEYIIIVSAVDANGVVSHPTSALFTPTMDLGDVVYSSASNWSEGKPKVTMGKMFDSEFYNITWYVAPQKGYTAYTMVEWPTNLGVRDDNGTGTPSDDIFTPYTTIDQVIQHILDDCARQSTTTGDAGKRCEYAESYSYAYIDPATDEYVEFNDLPGVYNHFFYGTKDESMIYTTWVDKDGNFHEPFVINPVTGKEIPLELPKN